jgi:hypothetical protein
MPTPDASQFTQFKKNRAIQERGLTDRSTRSITHLYQPVPSVSGLTDFLASFTNKTARPLKFTPINFNTIVKSKTAGVNSCN